MTSRRGRVRWSGASIRLRLLGGLALLLVLGLAGSTVASALLLDAYLEERNLTRLQTTADRVRDVLATGPQTTDGDQLGALLGPPLGLVAVDERSRVLLSTGAGEQAPAALARLTAGTTGEIVTYTGVADVDDLAATLVRTPELSILTDQQPEPLQPAAVVLVINTSLDDETPETLVSRQLLVVAITLVLLLGLAVVVLRVGLRPLTQMADTAEAIAQGSLSERLPTRSGTPETDHLAEAVNHAFDAQARAEATVRSFAADTSHELRTPLSTISGWLELRRQGGLSAQQTEAALEHIDREVGRMRLLTEELGLLARLDAGRPIEHDHLDLVALAASVVEDAAVVHPDRSVTLRAGHPVGLVGDAARLQQVLHNLVGNALQHTQAGAVRVEVDLTGGRARVRVVDHGRGLAPAEVSRVFERFWRAESSRSRSFGGSGLGLAIVEAIVHAHHGDVSVDSEVGVGTTVTVLLPLSPPTP